jgi:hypothetical protein
VKYAAESRGLRLCKAKERYAVCGGKYRHMPGPRCLCVGANVEDGLVGREAREP